MAQQSPLTRTRTSSRHSGFTLLELLVVIMIIGLMANFMILSYPESSPDEIAETETRKLGHLVSLASQDALLRSRSIALHVTPDGYRFLVRGKDGIWAPSTDKLFVTRKLPESIGLELNTTSDEGQFISPDQETAQIIISASGEITPFKIRLIATNSNRYTELTGDFSGQLTVKAHTEQP